LLSPGKLAGVALRMVGVGGVIGVIGGGLGGDARAVSDDGLFTATTSAAETSPITAGPTVRACAING
jgi:Na+/serine symporter